ncbi:uncharacterized protein MYCFIDRAFT_211055 [Pseudocercospora fijiensis CIRAD86]|uniref:Uncharacterized protein n=1 Tax=Pseudocercospora fijiensis (strain CIRAD86) TaxID=383855 RepID=M3B721_PSEFD|nr:uncharacterized protein MYCFIDRAFT_211055 [Pseudocercospora fijiensis CIRAD86]EME85128.1 hypothetical protein MYCFIDRAFT_211055 [Pseudocercospora fijiensis CIRAD86]
MDLTPLDMLAPIAAPQRILSTAMAPQKEDDRGSNDDQENVTTHDDLFSQMGSQFNDPGDREHDYPNEVKLAEEDIPKQ